MKATTSTPPGTSLTRAAPTAAVLAAAAVALVHVIAGATGDNLQVTPPGMAEASTVTLVLAVAAAVVGALAGTAVAALTRRAKTPRRLFLIITLAGLALSLGSPFTAADDIATALWLTLMHITVAACVIPTLARALPSRK
jgi:drug/metabolite transporter (DMT)-like permease